MPSIRARLLEYPILGSGREQVWSPGILLAPETWIVAAVAMTFLVSYAGHSVSRERRRALFCVLFVGATFLAGGALAMASSIYPAISATGWVARATAIFLAWTVIRMRPSPSTVRLWVYASFLAVTLVGVVALGVFYREFGFPRLSLLPIYRIIDSNELYGRVTYGHSGNTSSLLILIVPVAFALMLRREARRVERVYLAIVLIVGLANLAVAFQRWAWVTVLVAVMSTIWYWRSNRRSAWLIGALVLTALFVASAVRDALGTHFLAALSGGPGSNIGTRVDAWRQGMQFLIRNPAGYGYGMVNLIGLRVLAAHNLLIDNALEGGLLAAVGTVMWLSIHLARLAQGCLAPRRELDLPFALLLGFAAFAMYHVFFNCAWMLGGNMVWLALWWAYPAMAWSLVISDHEVLER